ncbi:hypothetical protein CEB3_c01110 [Peptococcaceae bacterium CEB3]|nr:hypothetical protein CEB3_c01110 [Peptococcaceae bacterium CEB3]
MAFACLRPGMARIKPGIDEDVVLGLVVQGQGLEEVDVVLNDSKDRINSVRAGSLHYPPLVPICSGLT